MDFYQKYLLINLKDYDNIGIDLEITKVLLAFVIALLFTVVAINLIRASMHALIKKLIRREAFSEDSALTLSELELDKFRIRMLLKSSGQLSKIVSRAGEKKYTYEEYVALSKEKGFKDTIDFKEARFYISEDGRDRATHIYEENEVSVLQTVLLCVLIVAVFVCIMLLMPSILTLINNLLG